MRTNFIKQLQIAKRIYRKKQNNRAMANNKKNYKIVQNFNKNKNDLNENLHKPNFCGIINHACNAIQWRTNKYSR